MTTAFGLGCSHDGGETDGAQHGPRSVLISGAGIAGLTAAVLLKEAGWEPVAVEREPRVPTEGYTMDLFGTGWDVAERMGPTDELQRIRYPIEAVEHADARDRPFLSVPIDRIRKAPDDRYVDLRRPDLARVLFRPSWNTTAGVSGTATSAAYHHTAMPPRSGGPMGNR